MRDKSYAYERLMHNVCEKVFLSCANSQCFTYEQGSLAHLSTSSGEELWGIFLSNFMRISILSLDWGIESSISFSNLPGRRSARSKESGRFVAAKINTRDDDDCKRYEFKTISSKQLHSRHSKYWLSLNQLLFYKDLYITYGSESVH